MPAKIILSVDGKNAAAVAALKQAGRLHTSPGTAGHHMVALEPVHFSARSELAKIAGIVVLPGVHDPGPIGAAAAAELAHVNAQPTETMRAVALRLAAKHGAAFDPDT